MKPGSPYGAVGGRTSSWLALPTSRVLMGAFREGTEQSAVRVNG
jgi:hypothetical protein